MTKPVIDRESAVAPAIDVRGLSYSYADSSPVLDEVCLYVNDGERVALVGPSGAGKSTLLLHLIGLLPQRLPRDSDAASIAVCGIPVRKSQIRAVRELVGFVFQDADDQLFCPTVREDVAFGPLNQGLSRIDVSERVSHALGQVGLSGFEDRSTLQLSAGERKRVCLAGVLACRPRILALDEPFANLDPRSRTSLTRILSEFDGAQIITTHDLDLIVQLCHRVVVLNQGTIKATGSVEEILANEELMVENGLEVPRALRT